MVCNCVTHTSRRRATALRLITSLQLKKSRACRSYLERELALLKRVQVVVALGKIAHDNYLAVLKAQGRIDSRAPYVFGHNKIHSISPVLIDSYHPSQQNTSTGKLTEPC